MNPKRSLHGFDRVVDWGRSEVSVQPPGEVSDCVRENNLGTMRCGGAGRFGSNAAKPWIT